MKKHCDRRCVAIWTEKALRRATLLCAAASFTVVLHGVAHAQDCTSAKDILDALPERPPLNVEPCDAVARAFLLGVTGRGRLAAARDPSLEDAHLYYLHVRYYLADEHAEASPTWDRAQFLRSYPMLLIARETLPDFGTSPVRQSAYTLFPAFAFAQYGTNDATVQDALISLLISRFQTMELNSGRKLYCFIKYDIPTEDERTILESDIFRLCSENSSD